MFLPPFEIHILGTSSAIPAFDRYPTSQFIQVNGSYILVDCGEGTQMQLRKYHLPFARIDVILISHLHGDHIFGLPGLLTSLSLLQRQKELIIIAPPALSEILNTIFKHSEAKINYPIQFIFTNQKVEKIFENEKFSIYTIPLKHRVPTTGFVIQEKEQDRKIIKEKIKEYNIPIHQFNKLKKGFDAEDENGNIIKNEIVTTPPPIPRKYVYFSDTAPLKNLPEITKNANILYHETTFKKEHQNLAELTLHSTTIDAANTAIQMNAQKLIIGHYSSRYEKLDDLLTETKSIFENTELATEGKKFSL
ncbi:MAG TPA: ribonuclease Z [Bacteroidia bacterium]|nr:ribonuclease Z [Bacteroidia bacterium]